MPTILTIGEYRFYFYSSENGEPPHIHVEAGDRLAEVLAFGRSKWHHREGFAIMS